MDNAVANMPITIVNSPTMHHLLVSYPDENNLLSTVKCIIIIQREEIFRITFYHTQQLAWDAKSIF
jgi:hypothetical protein